jgi:hypothetical protein
LLKLQKMFKVFFCNAPTTMLESRIPEIQREIFSKIIPTQLGLKYFCWLLFLNDSLCESFLITSKNHSYIFYIRYSLLPYPQKLPYLQKLPKNFKTFIIDYDTWWFDWYQITLINSWKSRIIVCEIELSVYIFTQFPCE